MVTAASLAPANAGTIQGNINMGGVSGFVAFGSGGAPSLPTGGGGGVMVGSGTYSPAASNATGSATSSTASGDAHNYGPDNKWGDPLSEDIFDRGDLRASLRYYGEAGRSGSVEAVGINLTLLSN
jgi:hypothetical protein